MGEDPAPIELKKHLIGIFMASMFYSIPLTMQFLEQRNITASLIDEMLNVRARFTHEYERRFFVVGLSRMLLSPQLPTSLQPRLVPLINNIVETLSSLHDQVTKRVEAQAKKEAKIDDDDSDEEDLEDDSDDEDEELQRPTKTKKSVEQEESKTATMHDDQLGFAEKAEKTLDDSDAASDGDIDENENA